MLIFILGLVLFFGTHLYSAFRTRAAGQDMRQTMGEPKFMALYSIVALVGFGLLVYGYGQAEGGALLYQTPYALRWVPTVLMLPALIFLFAGNLPTGRIKKALKHPMLVAVKIWAFSHLLVGGDLAFVVLMLSFLAYAVIDRIAAKKRGDLGPEKDTPPSMVGDIGAVVLGIVAYGALVHGLHLWLFGVSPLAI